MDYLESKTEVILSTTSRLGLARKLAHEEEQQLSTQSLCPQNTVPWGCVGNTRTKHSGLAISVCKLRAGFSPLFTLCSLSPPPCFPHDSNNHTPDYRSLCRKVSLWALPTPGSSKRTTRWRSICSGFFSPSSQFCLPGMGGGERNSLSTRIGASRVKLSAVQGAAGHTSFSFWC